jgi:hypothetical protein
MTDNSCVGMVVVMVLVSSESTVVDRTIVFFFDKSIYYQKRKGAQPIVHREYTRGIRERERKKRENLQS